MSNNIETVCTITGQIRRRRRLCKSLFFIDIKPKDNSPNSQIFFRSDDETLDDLSFQEAFRSCRPGHVIQVDVGKPLDHSEQHGKSYQVWQSNKPVTIIEPYTEREAFLQDPPLGNEVSTRFNIVCKYWINKNVCKQGDQCLYLHPTGEEFDRVQKKWVEEVICR